MSRIFAVTGTAVCLIGAFLLKGGPIPRLKVENVSLVIDYAPASALGPFVLAGGSLLLLGAASRKGLRVGISLLAALAAAVGVNRLLFRVEALPHELTARSFFGTTGVPWAEVSRIENGPTQVVVWGQADYQVRLSTGSLSPDQRATLDRTIARHVRESTSKSR